MTASAPFPVRCRSFQLQKGGNTAEEMEDAVATNPECGRFAVADGASETIFAGNWANMLASAFVDSPPRTRQAWREWVQPLRHRWWEEVRDCTLSWAAEHKLDKGAAATLLGLTLRPDATWSAVAVGDTCLFHTRGDEVIAAFPLSRSIEFNNHPSLIGSRPAAPWFEPLSLDGALQPGDRLWMMTDAVAQWFLKRDECDDNPTTDLKQLLDTDRQGEQTNRVIGWRKSRSLRNDDVMVLLIEG